LGVLISVYEIFCRIDKETTLLDRACDVLLDSLRGKKSSDGLLSDSTSTKERKHLSVEGIKGHAAATVVLSFSLNWLMKTKGARSVKRGQAFCLMILPSWAASRSMP